MQNEKQYYVEIKSKQNEMITLVKESALVYWNVIYSI